MDNRTYQYADMKPEQLEKLQQAERDLEKLTTREIVLVAYEKKRENR